ncbi:Cupin domain-containing protein [Geoalkalibacter ferrihydriticus]|uniref:Cupin domain-containing protein n=1 Tax=Geoalkalibacter ferrihydriticus TaxID=392333 RepID=A0A1G9LWT0_9BACT|nr:cupin domain-containing protein [Geoalkalibacter ferrihydriticus]SDL66363.1 Cupin domain-containing protein [Geoalkalibacter ferrihydriticus]
MDTSFFQIQDQIAFSDDAARKIALATTDHSRTTLWCLAPGQHIHPHVHAGDHVWVVLQGRGTFLGENEMSQEIGVGTVLVAPAGRPHGVRNDGDQGLVFVSVSAG